MDTCIPVLFLAAERPAPSIRKLVISRLSYDTERSSSRSPPREGAVLTPFSRPARPRKFRRRSEYWSIRKRCTAQQDHTHKKKDENDQVTAISIGNCIIRFKFLISWLLHVGTLPDFWRSQLASPVGQHFCLASYEKP